MSGREIVLDTETTGLDPELGDRIVEIGAVELVNYLPTGKTYHQYINPERDMPIDAYRVHGLSEEFLAEYPLFDDIAEKFCDFIKDSPLVIHNASFDFKFINSEFKKLGLPRLESERMVDTLSIAQKRFPGAPVSLDALCRRFGVDTSARTLHGALLDSKLLAECYLHLVGGRQTNFALEVSNCTIEQREEIHRVFREPRIFPAKSDEIERHQTFIESIDNPIWLR